LTPEEEKAGKIPQFRYLPNAIEVWGLQVLLLLAVHKFAPHFWQSQMSGGPLVLFLTFVGLGFFVTGPFEWFFHRFGLHGLLAFRALPWLKMREETGSPTIRAIRHAQNTLTIKLVYYIAKMTFGHGAHHKITDVTPVNPSRIAELYTIINKYEIVGNDQTEHAVFPHFSILGFWAFFLPLTAVMQVIANAASHALGIPTIPIILGATLAMSWQVWVYENSHAIMHKPFNEWWKPRIKGSVMGWWWSSVYRFHFFHHMNEKSSLGVVGSVWFCYFWDRVFGTYKLARLELIEAASYVNPEVLEMTKDEVRALPEARDEDFTAPSKLRGWVKFLDAQTVKGQEMFNKLFVEALLELRRRNKPNTPNSPAIENVEAKETIRQAVTPRIPVASK
jgi:hypothetical protein